MTIPLSGHVPVRNGVPLHPGRLGETVSIEQGIEAAQWTAMNALGACAAETVGRIGRKGFLPSGSIV